MIFVDSSYATENFANEEDDLSQGETMCSYSREVSFVIHRDSWFFRGRNITQLLKL